MGVYMIDFCIDFFILVSCTQSARPSWVYKTQNLQFKLQVILPLGFEQNVLLSLQILANKIRYKKVSLPEAQLKFFIVSSFAKHLPPRLFV